MKRESIEKEIAIVNFLKERNKNVQEFSNYVKLNQYDLTYAPHIFLIRLANSSYGFKECTQDPNQIRLLHFAFFRTTISQYLDENLDEISLALNKRVK